MATPSIGRVIGTAGHIDHGKTALVRALTGIDTDRLKEEKERGITIELGFAHLTLPSGVRAGVIDVPGHERFVRAMVAGAVGIDLVLLVVAADEGVMPQTREHLDICGLLGVERGVVALSKCDLVDPELRALAAADVSETLAGTFLEEAPIVPVSSKTGEGLDQLLAELDRGLADAPGKDPEGLMRLPIDRVFSMKGFGTVVTGTLWAGRLRVGDTVEALPPFARAAAAEPAKVRGLQVHGAQVEEAVAGQRTAANLAVARDVIERGQTVVHQGVLQSGQLLDVRIRYLPSCLAPLKRRSRVLFHAGTAQTLALVTLLDRAALEPGEEGLAQLHLDRPMVALPDDRFILRGFSMQRHHGTTLGGGVVLRTLGARHRRATAEVSELLRANQAAGLDERVALEVARAGPGGRVRGELQMRLAFTPRAVEAALTRLQTSRQVIRFDRERGAFIAAPAFAALKQQTLAVLGAYHAAHPLEPGMAREELRSRVSPDARLLHALLESLQADQAVVVTREVVRLPSHEAAKSQAASGLRPLAARVEQLYRDAGLAPPRPAETEVTLKVAAAELEPTLELLQRAGVMVRIKDLWFHRGAVDALRARLVAFLGEHGQITPQEWKELVGATRKFTIPLAEYFDAEKVTLRVGDVRKLRAKLL